MKNGGTGSHEQNANQSDFSKFQWSSSVNPVQSIQFPRVAAIPKKEPHREENSSSRDAPLAEMGGMEKTAALRIVDIFYRKYTMLISIDTPTICASREAFYYKHVSIQLPNHSVFAIISSEWKYFPNRTKYHCQIALDRSENPEKCTGLVESDHAHA